MKLTVREAFYSLKESIRIFRLFNDDETGKILPYLRIIDYPSGATVFREGDEGDFIGFVINGRFEVKKRTEFREREIVLAVLKRGAFVGEFSMLEGQKRTATIKALEDSSLLALSHDGLDSFISSYPGPGIKVLKGIIHTMSIRQQMTSERLLSFF
ncbi:MAG: cyclic nucleotide-binding domain-containing protein [Nitrospirae bacterium]|nr:cyclic nucleotide-binding domain-containing protein [Nitrospirota bacterium]